MNRMQTIAARWSLCIAPLAIDGSRSWAADAGPEQDFSEPGTYSISPGLARSKGALRSVKAFLLHPDSQMDCFPYRAPTLTLLSEHAPLFRGAPSEDWRLSDAARLKL